MNAIVTPIPTEEEIVQRARDLIPTLRERADACEKARMVSRETIKDFQEAGFFKILQPKRWGGYEMNPNVLNRVLIELARGCPSSAWNVMVLGVHPFEVGLLPEQVGDELWGEDNTRLVSSSYAPFGTVEAVEGGYRLNGEWLTSSGCDHAAGGAFVGGRVQENGEMVFRSFWVQREQIEEIVDDWHVVGLAGTGSKKLVIKDVFVPAYRSHVIGAYDQESHGQVENLFKMPFFYVFYAAVSSVIIGMARGMVDLYVEHMVPRQNLNQAVGAAVNDPFIKSRLGEALAKITGAEARVLCNTDEAWSYASRGELVPTDVRVRHFATNQFTGGDCFEAAHMIFKKTSTRGVWLNNPMQRQMRDILVGANHITQNQDNIGDLLGGHLLGNPLPQPNPFGVKA
ncbi:acyl-CoA dehydrogenase family protein [Marinobacterium sediminicola]|uniref:3-hydroxy-9,10-secoandrosta-1,3,5(10)-triene-9,17-dione monooxygenase n=1 Tax=Marinobacterium sediminicola TaxID=518898 RepID=A0ABY1S4H7_9GAMM|nr:acyl-CoA dehydrogenase family protein [Marinobacterium sediminicola]ULG68440.1 acyl-CoA dehydrogenase family protein [Marinobacterium sediminicola]SMR78480.1 3-hydroxy-9,10-secoandrosta-1,3,5(10)-triene-9,17-dione monooxygenase [Marinobacterium sediminicola]